MHMFEGYNILYVQIKYNMFYSSFLIHNLIKSPILNVENCYIKSTVDKLFNLLYTF